MESSDLIVPETNRFKWPLAEAQRATIFLQESGITGHRSSLLAALFRQTSFRTKTQSGHEWPVTGAFEFVPIVAGIAATAFLSRLREDVGATSSPDFQWNSDGAPQSV